MKSIQNSVNLHMVRSQKAKTPAKEEIQRAIEQANSKFKQNHHRLFLPEPYTR